jgi:Lrp/AsnC family transcriptional regulator, regulator for asnA, asnC and gidA
MACDETDLRILRILDRNSRTPYRDIARELKMHPNTVMERVKRMERDGVITGFRLDVDYEKLGMEISAFTELTFQGRAHTEVLDEVIKLPNVHHAYLCTGEYDALVRVICKNVRCLHEFTSKLDTIKGITRHNTKILVGKYSNPRLII